MTHAPSKLSLISTSLQSYFIHQERNTVPVGVTSSSGGAPGKTLLSSTITRKGTTRTAQQPLVNVSAPATATPTQAYTFEPGSLLANRSWSLFSWLSFSIIYTLLDCSPVFPARSFILLGYCPSTHCVPSLEPLSYSEHLYLSMRILSRVSLNVLKSSLLIWRKNIRYIINRMSII